MAFYKQEILEEPPESECPVCYESLSGTERTLSCGHVFCHDCLVQTLVCVNEEGIIRDTIVCPICRHLTFIKKQQEAVVSLNKENDTDDQQTLKVPSHAPQGELARLRSAPRATVRNVPFGSNWIVRWLRQIAESVRRRRLIRTSRNASQIFIISAEGRPMAEEDSLSVVMTVVQPRHPRRRICTTGRCLLFLLSTFTILALVAATLPWILLA